jgi:aerobic carbon-monoxide dehydrogenase medium subunit
VKPCRFAYFDPEQLGDALALAGEHGADAKVLAGGQSLVPMMNLRLVHAQALIDLNRISELQYVRREGDRIAIGAMTRQRCVERSDEASQALPLLAQAIPHIAYPAIRNRGTIGGSLVHADPAAELSCALLASEATVVLASAKATREVDIEEFLLGPYMTTRAADELLVELRVPEVSPNMRTAFGEVARKSGAFAICLVATVVTVENGRCRHAAIAIGGVGPVPRRSRDAEQVLVGEPLGTGVIAEAARIAAAGAEAGGDFHGSADYRRRLVATQVQRVLAQIADDAGEVLEAA